MPARGQTGLLFPPLRKALSGLGQSCIKPFDLALLLAAIVVAAINFCVQIGLKVIARVDLNAEFQWSSKMNIGISVGVWTAILGILRVAGVTVGTCGKGSPHSDVTAARSRAVSEMRVGLGTTRGFKSPSPLLQRPSSARSLVTLLVLEPALACALRIGV